MERMRAPCGDPDPGVEVWEMPFAGEAGDGLEAVREPFGGEDEGLVVGVGPVFEVERGRMLAVE